MDDLNFFEIDVSYVDYLKNIEINKRGFSRVPNMVYDKNRKQKLICGVVLVVKRKNITTRLIKYLAKILVKI